MSNPFMTKEEHLYWEGKAEMQKEFDILQSQIDTLKLERDVLQKKYDDMYNAFVVADDERKEWYRCCVGVRQREDELQKHIDEALDFLQSSNHYDEYYVSQAIKILKGLV